MFRVLAWAVAWTVGVASGSVTVLQYFKIVPSWAQLQEDYAPGTKEIVSLRSQDFAALYDECKDAIVHGKFDRGVEMCHEALAVNNLSAEQKGKAHNSLAYALYRMNRIPEAHEAIDQSLAENSEYLTTRINAIKIRCADHMPADTIRAQFQDLRNWMAQRHMPPVRAEGDSEIFVVCAYAGVTPLPD